MKVQLVCYEDIDIWILGKFAKKLNEELRKLGIDSNIGRAPDLTADINHHIIYLGYDGRKTTTDTLMITHIDTLEKAYMLKKQMEQVEMGIFMSQDTMERMAHSGLGIPREKLCYVNPAQDGIIKPRRTVVGITSKTHPDGRKCENMLVKLCEKISPSEFMFKIMGAGWTKIAEYLRLKGFTIEYYDAFDYEKYVELMPSLDYYLYFSNDEGSMGFLDALAAGVKTIVTPQGYHLDAKNGITYSISGLEELETAFKKIADEKRKLTDSVKDWTWANYAFRHAHIWGYILDRSKQNAVSEQPVEVLQKVRKEY